MAGHFSRPGSGSSHVRAADIPSGLGVTCGLKGVGHLLGLKKQLWILETGFD